MAIIDEHGVVLRNIQEQVQKNKCDIEELKQAGMGHEPVPGPIGPAGEQGPVGPEGERGASLYGTSAMLPSPTAYKDGDMFLLNSGALYKKVNGRWIQQATLRGPQGVQGDPGSQVIPNPEGDPQDELSNLEIDGVRYRIVGDPQWGNIGGVLTEQADLWEQLTNIREVAEGKSTCWLMNIMENAPTTDERIQQVRYIKADGSRIQSLAEYQEYVGDMEYSNHIFGDGFLNIPNAYIILRKDGKHYVLIADDGFSPLKDGDIILTEQTDKVDYWFWSSEEFYVLETSKLDLTNYAKLDIDNNFSANQTMPSITLPAGGEIKTQGSSASIAVWGGSVTLSKNIDASTNNTYDIGSSSVKWKDLYLSGNIKQPSWTFGERTNGNFTFSRGGSDRISLRTSDFIPNSDNSITLGADGLQWKNVKTYEVNSAVGLKLSAGNNTVTFHGAMVPDADWSYPLGTSAARWSSIACASKLTIGTTDLTEAQLQALLALIA